MPSSWSPATWISPSAVLPPISPRPSRAAPYTARSAAISWTSIFSYSIFPRPNISAEKRFTTTVPLQRLFLMNSDFMQAEAEQLAKRVATEPDNRARIKKAYLLVYGRDPSEQEIKLGIEYLHAEPMREFEENKNKPPEGAPGGGRGGRGGGGGGSSVRSHRRGQARHARRRSSGRRRGRRRRRAHGNGHDGRHGRFCRRIRRCRRTPRRRAGGSRHRQVRTHRRGAATPRCCSVPASFCSSTKRITPMSTHKSSNPLTRREALRKVGNGFGMMAFAGMLGNSLARAGAVLDSDGNIGMSKLDYPQRVKRVIFLFMNGGCSSIDSFDPKPDARKVRRPAASGRHHQDRAPHRRTDEVAVQIQKVRTVRHGRQRTLAAPRRSRRRHLLGPLRLHRYPQSRAFLPDDEHRRQSGRPPLHGRLADLRAGHRKPEPARLCRALSRRAHHRRTAAVE